MTQFYVTTEADVRRCKGLPRGGVTFRADAATKKPGEAITELLPRNYSAVWHGPQWADYAPRHCPKTGVTSKVSMLTKMNIVSCETCGRIVTRSRIDGFPRPTP